MATYLELRNLFDDGDLVNRTTVAIVIEAQILIDSVTPTTAQKSWANQVLANPRNEAEKVMKYVLAINEASSVAAITGATDAALQANVADAVPILVDALAGT